MIVNTISSPEFKARVKTALPKNVDPDRFTRMTMTAIQGKPDLLEADKDSLYLAILQCAQTGLAPDGKEAALVVFNTNVGSKQNPRWVKQVQFMPMVAGVIKKLGELDVKCDAAVVYENDVFEYEEGDFPRIIHKPAKLGTERGVAIGAYAILRPKNGEPYREVMSSAEIEQVRQQSRAANSLMWTQFWGEGARKTVLRRCAKRIPMPFDDTVEKTLEADNATFEMAPEPVTEPAADPTVVATQEPQPEPAAATAAEPQPVAEKTVVESENPAPPSTPAPAPRGRPRRLSEALKPTAMPVQVDLDDIF